LSTQAEASKLLPLLSGLLGGWQSVGAASPGDRGQKTQPCKFWEMGQCIKGDACDFVHGPQRAGAAAGAALSSMTLPQSSSQALSLVTQPAWAASATSTPALAAISGGGRTNSTPSGGQRKGALCKYFQQGVTCHAGSACTYAHGIHELAGGFKQRICKFFDQTGQCSKGDSCTYAHGAHELLVGEALAGAMSRAASEESAASGQLLALADFAAASSSSSDQAAWPLGAVVPAAQPGAVATPGIGGTVSATTTALDLTALTELAASLASPWGQLAGAATAEALGGSPDSKSGGAQSYKRALCKYFQLTGTCSAGATCTYAHGVEELTQGYKRNLCRFYLETGTCAKGSECTFAHGMEELQAA